MRCMLRMAACWAGVAQAHESYPDQRPQTIRGALVAVQPLADSQIQAVRYSKPIVQTRRLTATYSPVALKRVPVTRETVRLQTVAFQTGPVVSFQTEPAAIAPSLTTTGPEVIGGSCCQPTYCCSPPAGYRPVYVYRPILPIQSVPSDVYIGPGILGQPTAYAPGQPLRNFLRYLTP